MTLGKVWGITVGAADATEPAESVADEVAMMDDPNHIDVAVFVPVGYTDRGADVVC